MSGYQNSLDILILSSDMKSAAKLFRTLVFRMMIGIYFLDELERN